VSYSLVRWRLPPPSWQRLGRWRVVPALPSIWAGTVAATGAGCACFSSAPDGCWAGRHIGRFCVDAGKTNSLPLAAAESDVRTPQPVGAGKRELRRTRGTGSGRGLPVLPLVASAGHHNSLHNFGRPYDAVPLGPWPDGQHGLGSRPYSKLHRNDPNRLSASTNQGQEAIGIGRAGAVVAMEGRGFVLASTAGRWPASPTTRTTARASARPRSHRPRRSVGALGRVPGGRLLPRRTRPRG
jgi:hypothetical protein